MTDKIIVESQSDVVQVLGTTIEVVEVGGPPGLPGVRSASNITALQAVNVQELPDGAEVYVETLMQKFVLSTSSLPLKTAVVVAALNSAGRSWVRDNNPHPYWRTRTTFYIDAISGNDENTGAIGLPLKTAAELHRRWGDKSLLAQGTAVNVRVLSSLPDTDPLRVNYILGPDTVLQYTGPDPTVDRSGTISSVLTKDRATNQRWSIGDVDVDDWSLDVGKIVQITSGVATGAVAWVIRGTGSTCLLSDLMMPDLYTKAPAPEAGDTYQVESRSTVSLGDTFCEMLIANSPNAFPLAVFSNFVFQNSDPLEIATGAAFLNCKFIALAVVNFPSQLIVGFSNCYLQGGVYGGAGEIEVLAGFIGPGFSGASGVIKHGARVMLDGDVIVQGTMMVDDGSLYVGYAGIFDTAVDLVAPFGDAVMVGANYPSSDIASPGPAGTVRIWDINYGGHLLWGNGNAGVGVNVAPGGKVVYKSTAPTVTGILGDFRLGGALGGFAFDPSTAAFVGPIVASWANLAAAIGDGGFGGDAQSPAKGSCVVKGT